MKKEIVKALPADLTEAYTNYISFIDAAPRTVQTYNGNIKKQYEASSRRVPF